jgi:dethiobiotin synthetase
MYVSSSIKDSPNYKIPKMTKKYFITATGTDIGKSFVTCHAIKQLKNKGKSVAALKPVISGFNINSDSDTSQILASLGLDKSMENIEAISPWRFDLPLSPDIAARQQGVSINFEELIEFCQKSALQDYLLIEAAGGVMVPLNEDYHSCHWMAKLDFKNILVAGSYLGSISHTLSAIESMRSYGAKLHAIIINQSQDCVGLEDMVETLKNFTDSRIYTVKHSIQENIEDITEMFGADHG